MKVKVDFVMKRASGRLRAWPPWRVMRLVVLGYFMLGCCRPGAVAQNCQTSNDLDNVTRAAITTAGQRYFELTGKGDVASLRRNAAAGPSGELAGIDVTVKDHQSDLAGAQSNVKSLFLLAVEGTAPVPKLEFYCGVFGKNGQTSDSAVFALDNLAPGKYAAVILDASSPTARSNFSVMLQQAGSEWKLWGLYITLSQVAGHDSDWFAARAREYKGKGQLHNSWLFFLQARKLSSPLPFMSTLVTDKLYDEFQSVQPTDVPSNGKTVDLAAGTSIYKLMAMFPEVVGNDLDLIVKYQTRSVSDTIQANQNNIAVMKALVAKYPELRDAFAGIAARAVDPSAHGFGTLRAMKEIK